MVLDRNGFRVERQLQSLTIYELLRQSGELSERELSILILTAHGETHSSISRVLRVHKSTVSRYARRARDRAKRVLTPPHPKTCQET